MPRLLGFLGLFLVAACRTDEAGAAPGFGDPARGFALVRARGCTSCHASEEVGAEPAPSLLGVGARLTPAAIEASLGAGARMPDCFGGLGVGEREAARSELLHLLASLGGPVTSAPRALDALVLERGRQLYHSVGCVACHEPFEAVETLAKALWEYEDAFEPAAMEGPRSESGARDPRSLAGIAARTTLEALANYLEDPLLVHPAGRMPSLGLTPREAADLAAYLFYEDSVAAGAVLAQGEGLQLDVYEQDFSGASYDFSALAPVRTETVTSFFADLAHPADDFGFRFRGLIQIDVAGTYSFATRSDDGSMLFIDQQVVVDNHGQHGMEERSGEVFLGPGRHAFELTYFEHLGDEGLEVSWSGPGFERRALGFEGLSHLEVRLPRPRSEPFVLDEGLVERGRERYEALGCANCHTRCGESFRPLAELDPRRGCLATEPRGSVPRFRFAPGEREDLVAALRAKRPPPRSAAERLQDELARLECGACHTRDGPGGPDDARRRYFQVARGLDLGDEGRLPPSLERVGAKLRPEWMRAVLERGGRVRPYMTTRMPRFGAANVAELPALFAEADAAWRDEREPEFSLAAVEAGKTLAGTKGLGCIQCHELAGHPSIGIPAVDLAHVAERIYPGWFRALLMDPVGLKMNTRMPAFWVDGRSPVRAVCEGDPAAQVDALWTYLALGSSMPLPFGLVPLEGEYEVEVTDTPVSVGVFMKGVSPRTVAVGLPERVHYAFDVQSSRLALAWRGRFLDARGTWFGRAGELERPAGEDVLELPRVQPFALLEHPDDPWPTAIGPAAGYRALGRTLDADLRPVFRYGLGSTVIEESIVPVVRPGGAGLVRRWRGESSAGERHQCLVAVGDDIQKDGTGWVVRGEQDYRVELRPPDRVRQARVVSGPGGRAELRLSAPFGVPFALSGSTPWTEVEYSW